MMERDQLDLGSDHSSLKFDSSFVLCYGASGELDNRLFFLSDNCIILTGLCGAQRCGG